LGAATRVAAVTAAPTPAVTQAAQQLVTPESVGLFGVSLLFSLGILAMMMVVALKIVGHVVAAAARVASAVAASVSL